MNKYLLGLSGLMLTLAAQAADAPKAVLQPGARLQDNNPSGPSKSITIQGYLDAKPDLFRQRAKALQELGAKTVAVAGKKDLKALNQISDQLDGVCKACHRDFWYPEQMK